MNRVNTKNIKKIKKKKKRFSFVKFFIKLILIAILMFGIWFGVKTYKNGGGIQGVLATIFGQSPETLKDLDTIYVLVMGISEDLDSKLTDTIILCAYNPKQQTASMLSIPRDTFVGKSKLKAKGSDKINSLYSSNPQKTMDAVSKITGIDINYYAVINTKALIKIVDIIGGVNFVVPINMNYDDPTQDLHIHLKSGMQKINGEKAEQLLRFRKNNNNTSYPAEYGADDYGRMRTQREFITETAKQTIKFKNITKIKSLIKAVFDNVDTNVNMETIFSYIPYVVNFDTSNIQSEQLPGASDKINNIWFFLHDEKETLQVVEKINNSLEGNSVSTEGESNTTEELTESSTSNVQKSSKTTNTLKNTNSVKK